MNDEDQEAFKKVLDRFVRIYALLSQVFPDNDPDTERLYVYCRALQQTLPDGESGRLQLGDKVILTHLALEDDHPGIIELADDDADPVVPFPW